MADNISDAASFIMINIESDDDHDDGELDVERRLKEVE